jgi:ketosteroid isomerase-like protein
LCIVASEDHIAIARRGYELLAARDLDGVLELIDPEVELEIHTGRPDLPESERLYGHAGFRENLMGLMEVFEDVEVTPEEFIEVGDQLVVPIFTAGHGRTSGIRVENRVTHVWTIRDGKATRFRVFPTTEQALEAARLG